MLSKEDWIASHRKQFPDARPDVLGFIYDFSSRSSDLYEVFVNGYCFYFANMLREAFNGGDVCWSVDYLGALVNDFKHNGWKYIPTAKLDFTQTVESDAIKYWDNYVGQLVVHNGNVYLVI